MIGAQQQRICPGEQPPLGVGVRLADIADPVAIDGRLDVVREVLDIGRVDLSGENEPATRQASCLDRPNRTLVRHEPAEKEQIALRLPAEGKALDVDPMVNRRERAADRKGGGTRRRDRVVGPRVGVPDRLSLRHERIVVGRQDGGSRRHREDQALDPGVVVDDVELAPGRGQKTRLGVCELEVFGMAQAVGDVAIPNGRGGDASQRRRRRGVTAREEGDVVTTPDQLFGQKVNDELSAAVSGRRDAFVRRCKLGDTQRILPWGARFYPSCYAPPR